MKSEKTNFTFVENVIAFLEAFDMTGKISCNILLLPLEMGIVFFNERNFWERAKLFVNNGVVQKKRTMGERNESLREMKKWSFLETNDKKWTI